MGRLPHSALEVRLAALPFLLLLGLGDPSGAWEVANFSAFTPSGVAATVAPPGQHTLAADGPMAGHSMAQEEPVDLAALDRPRHNISRDLLVQDTHVHVPVYALTA